jgi:hypothetical protein
LLRPEKTFHYMQHARNYGLQAENFSFDLAAFVEHSRGVSGRSPFIATRKAGATGDGQCLIKTALSKP